MDAFVPSASPSGIIVNACSCRRPNMHTIVSYYRLVLALLLCAPAWGGVEARQSPYKPFVLKYFVHIEVNGALGATDAFLPALNSSFSADFGSGSLFALNVTEAVSPTSRQLGYSRGYAIETSYLTGVSRGIETVVLEYADGGKHNGTFVITGAVGTSGTNEVAIVGGTGTFRGANGYTLISFAAMLKNGTLFTFAHEAHFL